MHIAILSRNKNLHSIRRLLQEAKKARIQCDVIDPLECEIVIDGTESRVTRRWQISPPLRCDFTRGSALPLLTTV